MTIIDDECLAEFRSRGQCELCGRRVYPLDPHHAFIKRGIGGGSRLDVPENLAALDRLCHGKAEHSTEFNEQVQAVVAKRVGASADDIRTWLQHVLRTDKAKPMPERPWKVAAA